MNGATAELWANSISPPKSAMTRKTGNSQNFLRTRRKAQNSRRKPSIRSSELVPECFGCGAGRFAHDPVALRRWLEFPPHRITVNLAPADVRKAGASFDLPLALGVLAAQGVVTHRFTPDIVVVGELSLDGTIQATRGPPRVSK